MKITRKIMALALMLLAAAPAAALDCISLTYIKMPFNVPNMVEKHLGIFAKHFAPLPVEYAALSGGPEQVHALAAGDIHFLNAVGSTSVFLSSANGSDIKILSVFGRSPGAFKLLAAADSPLARPSDLRGKTVGGPKGTILHELLAAWLATEGMTVRDVQFVNMPITAAQAALAAGKVDVAMVTGLPAWRMAKEGYKVLCDGKGLVKGEVLSAVSEAFMKGHPELVKAFMAAKVETLRWMAAHPDETIAIVMAEMGLTRDEALELYGQYDFSMEITDEDLKGLQHTVDFMASQGMLERSLNVKDLIVKTE